MSEYKLSLPFAILININVMLGSGIFINTVLLAKKTGFLGALSYALVALAMMPIIITIATLLQKHPNGGFYTFAKQEIGTFAGFLSAWTYFISKLASAMLVIHIAVLFLQQTIGALNAINTFVLDLTILILFILLNLKNIRTGSAIQAGFMAFKIIPIFFIILTGLFFISGSNFSSAHLVWEGIPSSIPLVIFALLGFEAAASISSKIENAHKNAPRAVLISCLIVAFLAILYQTIFYAVLGHELAALPDFRVMFPAYLHHIADSSLANMIYPFFHIAIAASAFGGSYGILFSNNWNLYTIAQERLIPGSSYLVKLNKNQIPWVCMIIEGIIAALYLFISRGNQVPLQQIAAFGTVTAYTISAYALVRAQQKNPALISRFIPLLAVISCILMLSICIYNFVNYGPLPILLFSTLLMIGISLYMYQKTIATSK